MMVQSPSVTRRALLAGLAALGGAGPLAAQILPAAPITLIVPFAAGGPTDIVARLAAEGLSRHLNRPVIVENVGGAGGATGTLRAARSRADGSVMVLGQMATHALTPILNPQAGYDPVQDFEPIGIVANAPMVLAARKGLPAATLGQFLAHVKAHGQSMSFGHAGLGATSQVACELFNLHAEVMPASVAYRGTAPALNDLVGGQIDYVCDQLTSIAPLIRSGAVTGITLMAPQRAAILPELASSAEQGFGDLSVEVWNGLLFPRGTPQPVIAEAHAALIATLREPQVQNRMTELGATTPEEALNTPAAFRDLIAKDNARWRQVLNRLK